MPIVKDVIINEAGKETVIYFEVDDIPGAQDPYIVRGPIDHVIRGPVDQVLTTTKGVFSCAMELIHDCAEQVAKTINSIDQSIGMSPSEIEVQLAIKLDAEIGAAILVKTTAEAQLQVIMKWTKKDQAPQA